MKISHHLQSLIFGTIFIAISACSADKEPAPHILETSAQPGASSTQDIPQPAQQTDTVTTQESFTRLSVSGQEFFRALLSLDGHPLAGHFNIQVPSIWVFSANRQMTQLVADDNALEAFQTEFSTIDPQSFDLTCEQMESAISKAAGKEWSVGCTGNQWTALLLVSTGRCEQSCPKYEHAAAQAEKNHPDALQVKTLILEF